MLWASRMQALGSTSRPSASRTSRRSRPLSWSKTPSFCQAAKSVDGFPRGEVVWQVPPGNTGPVDVEDGVHDPAQVVFGRPPDVQALPSALGSPDTQGWFEQFPTGIGQVTRLRPLSARHVSVVPMAVVRPKGANRRDRERVGIRRERRDRNGPSKAVTRPICHNKRLSPQ